jgi:uncharacterized protein DUF4157
MREQTTAQTIVKPSFAPTASGLLQRACACGRHTATSGGECEECRKKHQGVLQRAAVNRAPVQEVPPIVYEVLGSPGRTLDVQTRQFMEPRFGHDFSNVRVHTDSKAAESARAVNALAYTVGRSIVFGDSQYMPHSVAGQTLLAHELTHVVQQGFSGAIENESITHSLTIGPNSDPLEAEAQSWAAKTHGQSQSPLGRAPGALVQRQDRGDARPETRDGRLRRQARTTIEAWSSVQMSAETQRSQSQFSTRAMS